MKHTGNIDDDDEIDEDDDEIDEDDDEIDEDDDEIDDEDDIINKKRRGNNSLLERCEMVKNVRQIKLGNYLTFQKWDESKIKDILLDCVRGHMGNNVL